MKLDIVTPSLSGLVHHSHMNIMPALLGQDPAPELRYAVQKGMPLVGLARNLLVAKLTPENPADDWRDMIWIDADTIVEPDTVVRLWESARALRERYPNDMDRLMLSAVVPGRMRGPAHGELELSYPLAEGVYRTDHVGFGLVFVSGPMIRAMRFKAKAFNYEGKIHHDYFPTGPDKREYMGEDVGFCRLAFNTSCHIYVDTNIVAGHYEGRV